MFGRLPWLALERRMRALRFLVFFDIGVKAIGQRPQRHKAVLCLSPHVIASRICRAVFAVVRTDVRDTFILPGLAKLGFLASNGRHFWRSADPCRHGRDNGSRDDGGDSCDRRDCRARRRSHRGNGAFSGTRTR